MNTAGAIADTLTILATWGNTFPVYRNTPTWSGGVATDSWSLIGSISGDHQPVSGATMIAEQGLKVKSESEIHTTYDAGVQVDDKIDFGGAKWMLVCGIAKYDDRKVVRLRKTEGAA